MRDVDEAGDGEFTVCWDPLDGSSIVDNNWAVGTIMGVWPKKTGLIGATGRDQVTSLVALYGPRTTVLVRTCYGLKYIFAQLYHFEMVLFNFLMNQRLKNC